MTNFCHVSFTSLHLAHYCHAFIIHLLIFHHNIQTSCSSRSLKAHTPSFCSKRNFILGLAPHNEVPSSALLVGPHFRGFGLQACHLIRSRPSLSSLLTAHTYHCPASLTFTVSKLIIQGEYTMMRTHVMFCFKKQFHLTCCHLLPLVFPNATI